VFHSRCVNVDEPSGFTPPCRGARAAADPGRTVLDCDAVVQADSDEELMAQVRPHAHTAHGVEVTTEMERQLLGLVRQV